jgi:hypothetical protein
MAAARDGVLVAGHDAELGEAAEHDLDPADAHVFLRPGAAGHL